MWPSRLPPHRRRLPPRPRRLLLRRLLLLRLPLHPLPPPYRGRQFSQRSRLCRLRSTSSRPQPRPPGCCPPTRPRPQCRRSPQRQRRRCTRRRGPWASLRRRRSASAGAPAPRGPRGRMLLLQRDTVAFVRHCRHPHPVKEQRSAVAHVSTRVGYQLNAIAGAAALGAHHTPARGAIERPAVVLQDVARVDASQGDCHWQCLKHPSGQDR